MLLKRRARRRLVGAIALVLLAVIVLPVVLDHEPKLVQHDLTVQIPSQDAGKFGARVLQKSETAATPGRTTGPAPAPESSGTMGKLEPSKPEAKAEASPKAAPKQPSESASKPPAGRKEPASRKATSEEKRALALLNDEAYVVPLGAFSNPDNAKQIREKVAAAGFQTYIEKIDARGVEQTRVRAGPFENRAAAEKARDKLKSLGIPVGQVSPR